MELIERESRKGGMTDAEGREANEEAAAAAAVIGPKAGEVDAAEWRNHCMAHSQESRGERLGRSWLQDDARWAAWRLALRSATLAGRNVAVVGALPLSGPLRGLLLTPGVSVFVSHRSSPIPPSSLSQARRRACCRCRRWTRGPSR